MISFLACLEDAFRILDEYYLGIQQQYTHRSQEIMVTETKTKLHTNLAGKTMTYTRALYKNVYNPGILCFVFVYLIICLDRVLL